MNDLGITGNNGKGKFDQMTKNSFFTFSKPYLDFIGKGTIYSFVYFVMAAINLILPFVAIFTTIESGIFRYGKAEFVFAIILSWLVIAFACWIGFQLWWDRRTRIAHIASSEFIATPIFSQILQTFGEWLGTLIGIIGAGVGLIALLFLGSDANVIFRSIGMGFMPSGAMVIIIGPIIGFFIIIVSHFFAEQLRILAALANNTKEIATNLKIHVKANEGKPVEKGIEATNEIHVDPPAPPKRLSQINATYIVKEKMKLYENRGDYTNVVCILNPDENVSYLETGTTASVRNIPAPMFYIKTSSGKLGWCYSGFLERKTNNEE
jgi:hypothetical protein